MNQHARHRTPRTRPPFSYRGDNRRRGRGGNADYRIYQSNGSFGSVARPHQPGRIRQPCPAYRAHGELGHAAPKIEPDLGDLHTSTKGLGQVAEGLQFGHNASTFQERGYTRHRIGCRAGRCGGNETLVEEAPLMQGALVRPSSRPGSTASDTSRSCHDRSIKPSPWRR